MDPASSTQQLIGSGSEQVARTTDENSRAIGDDENDDNGPSHQPFAYPAESASDASAIGEAGKGGDVGVLAGLLVSAIRDSVAELRREDEARNSQFTTALLEAFSKGEEIRLARFEKTIASWKPPKLKTDPTTNFWTVYKKVADEHDNDLVSKYVGDLDTSLLFAGLFSAITSSFIIQIIPSLQPDSSDLTNALLLRILQQNTSFDGADPLAPVTTIPTSIATAQAILLASFGITLFVAFIAVLGKQWILYYTRVSTWGNVVDRGRERQVKLAGLQKWGLHLIMESLPVMLQLALLLFGIALVVYLWDIDISAAEVSLVVTCIGFAFYCFIAVAATIWKDCPFQTPFSVIVPKVLPWAKEFVALGRVSLRRRSRKPQRRIGRVKGYASLTKFLERIFKLTSRTPPQNQADQNQTNRHNDNWALSNPALWRSDSLFNSPVRKDIAASAASWLLENSTDFSAATAVAAVFSEFQWPSHQNSTTALIRLRDTYTECFRAERKVKEPGSKKPVHLKALQSAAAYYVLYHTQLIWSASKSLEKLSPDLPPDLFLYKHSDEWGGDDLFEYLLHIRDCAERSKPVTSVRFLSYIAPYWFCGDSDSAIRFRPSRLQTLHELIDVLEDCQALLPATLTDCVLCVGAAMDFPLHPEDLIRVDKSDHFQLTFKKVVEHIYTIALNNTGRRRRYARPALEIILRIAKRTALPLVGVGWINNLLWRAAEKDMDDFIFVLFLRLRASRKEEDGATDGELQSAQEYDHTTRREAEVHSPGGTLGSANLTLEHTILSKISKNVKTCSDQEGGWQDDLVFGGLIAVRDIPQLGSCLPEDGFLQTLADAMENDKPFRVRKAAYAIIEAAQDGWLNSAGLRQILDFPRKLHGVVAAIGRHEHQLSFLKMMEILSKSERWHSYLRGIMDIWLPLRNEGPPQTIRILVRIGQIQPPDSYDLPLDNLMVKIVGDEWTRVPGRPTKDLSIEQLEPLAEVTTQLKMLLFTEGDRQAVLTRVEQVVPSLEKRSDDGYNGPSKEVREMFNNLIDVLQVPSVSTSRRSTFW